MKIVVTEHVIRIVVLAPEGRIDAFSAPELRKKVDTLFDENVSRFVFDLTNVEFMDSAGMAVLVSALKRARQKEGDVILIKPKSEATMRILLLTKLDRVFNIVTDVGQAVEAF